MSPTGLQSKEPAKIQDQYRPLDIPKNEICLLSFEETSSEPAENAYLHLKLHYVILEDRKPEYVAFCDRNVTMDSSQLREAWGNRLEFTTRAPQHEIYNKRFQIYLGRLHMSKLYMGALGEDNATIYVDGMATVVSMHLKAALQDLQESYECRTRNEGLGFNHQEEILCCAR